MALAISSWIEPTRIITIALCIAGLTAWALWMRKEKKNWGYAVPIQLYLLHTMLFYIILFFPHGLSADELNLWSTIIRLQALVTILGVGIVLTLEKHEP